MGFLAPWFLAGLAALAVPVFVHLLRKHATTPRPVSSLMFFERGIQSSTRHKRLRYLLLFALRAALLLLVVLAFASPFVRRHATDTNGRLLLIVLDNSFSMRAGVRFTDAKQQALTLLAAKPHSQMAQIIALGGQIEILTQPIIDDAQLRSSLEAIQPGDGRANFGALGRSVRAIAETAHRPIDLHLFSDMQRTAMPSSFADMVLPVNVTLVLHDVAKGKTLPNWTVEPVSAPAELADPKDPKRSHVQAVIAGFSTPEAEKTVSLIVNGKTIATHKVKVPANGRETVEFAPIDVGYGFNRCEVRIDGEDGFPADDASNFVIRRSDPERVLFVHSVSDTRSSVYFGAALGAAEQASFVLQSVTAEQATDLDPSRFVFVVLSDTTALPSIFEHTLAQYVTKGGSVLITLGTNAGQDARIPLWGANVKDVHDYARTRDAATVGQVDFTYPAFEQEQAGHDNGGWAETKFFYAASVDPGQARVAARLNDGTPLLLDKQTGEGHVLLFTSGLENLTNDLPLHPVFVAFVDKASRYLSGREQLSSSQLVDSFVRLRSAGESAGQVTNVEVIDPVGRRPLSLSEARNVQTFRLQHAGFYQIRFANGQDALIGVNPDRRESDLQPIAQDVQQLWSGNNSSGASEQRTAVDNVKYRVVHLWWYVMLLALVVALAETALASRYLGTQREEA
ncbi:BatA and WFA domain-containing protein [Alloacidobacterium sp.]|uniref:vWA domain-containing protein n=1 Tax=Alloacidobacterium sp. TaxID=2951999 RepID=UPI002D5961DA|nr:BatA and WFA domain-containing protein [Alloacidobacterium sp.]HYK36551.1 BatA and WFA domain-containing protein [Alloacidobacterium sp.]